MGKIFTDVLEGLMFSPQPVSIGRRNIPLVLPKTGFKFSGIEADIPDTAMTEQLG